MIGCKRGSKLCFSFASIAHKQYNIPIKAMQEEQGVITQDKQEIGKILVNHSLTSLG